MLAANSTTVGGQPCGVFYIDTENAFSSSRLSEILQTTYPMSPESEIVDIIQRVTLFNPTTSNQLYDTLKNMRKSFLFRTFGSSPNFLILFLLFRLFVSRFSFFFFFCWFSDIL